MALWGLIREEIIEDKKKMRPQGHNLRKTYISDCKESEISVPDYQNQKTQESEQEPITNRKCSARCVTLDCDLCDREGKRKGKPDYARLYEAGRDALEPNLCLEAALFLHAIDMVRSAKDADFEAMRERFVPHWSIRLDASAWAIVQREIEGRQNRYPHAEEK